MIASLLAAALTMQCGLGGCAAPGLFSRRYTYPVTFSYIQQPYIPPSDSVVTYSPWQSHVSAFVKPPITKKWLWAMYEGKRRLVWGWKGDDGMINWYQHEQPDPTTPTSPGVDATQLTEPGNGREAPAPEPPPEPLPKPRGGGNIGTDQTKATEDGNGGVTKDPENVPHPFIGQIGADHVTNYGVDVSKFDRGHSIRASDDKTLTEVLKVASDSKIANEEADMRKQVKDAEPDIRLPNPVAGIEAAIRFAVEMIVAALLFIGGFLLLRGKQ